MASLRTNIPLSIGLVATTVRIDSAVPTPKSELRSVCPTDNHPVNPDLLHMKYTCDFCGPIDKPRKARKVAGAWQVTDAEAVNASRAAAAEPFKYALVVGVYPTADAELSIAEGSKAYWLAPDGIPETYTVIADAVGRHPELMFLTRFALRSAVTVYRLTVREGALMITEYLPRTSLRPAPQVPTVTDPRLSAAMDLVLPTLMKDFTPDVVALPDTLGAAFENAATVPVEAPVTEPTGTDALLALLEAELAKANKPKRTRTRKTTPKPEEVTV